MGLLQLNSCCYVLDLKRGNILLGCLHAVFSCILLIAMSAMLFLMVVFDPNLNHITESPGIFIMYLVCSVLFAAKLCFDVVFIYGAVKERVDIIKAYCIMWVTLLFLEIICFIYFLVTSDNVGISFMEIIYVVINIFSILLTHSYYSSLQSRDAGKEEENLKDSV